MIDRPAGKESRQTNREDKMGYGARLKSMSIVVTVMRPDVCVFVWSMDSALIQTWIHAFSVTLFGWRKMQNSGKPKIFVHFLTFQNGHHDGNEKTHSIQPQGSSGSHPFRLCSVSHWCITGMFFTPK